MKCKCSSKYCKFIKKSFVELMSESLKKRKKGVPVRFVYDKSIPENLLKKLLKKLRTLFL